MRFKWNVLCIVMLVLMAACQTPTNPPVEPKPITLTGEIRNTNKAALENVQVQIVDSTVSGITNAKGEVKLQTNSKTSITLKISKSGYAEQFKVINVNEKSVNILFTAELLPREPARTMANIEGGGQASAKQGARVELPAQALVTADGQPVTGSVQVTMTPVNVASDDIGGFPGAYAGIASTGENVPLVSYGTVEFEFTQNGKEVNLAPGKTATIELPMYATKHDNGNAIKVGDTIPLWSLNEKTGIWQQEGAGTVVGSSMSPTGFALRATVGHFSWWNCDNIPQIAEIIVTYTTPGVQLIAFEAELVARVLDTDFPLSAANTTLEIRTPSPRLRIPAGKNIRLSVCAVALIDPPGILGEGCGAVTVNVPAGELERVLITLEAVEDFSIELTKPFEDITTDQPVQLEAVVTGSNVDVVQFFARKTEFPFNTINIAILSTAPFSLTWDTSQVKQGRYEVYAQGKRNLAVHGTQSRFITIDRSKPPPVASFTSTLDKNLPAITYLLDPSASVDLSANIIDFYVWDFGDGDQRVTVNPQVIEHRYLQPGKFPITLTVFDIDGESGTSSQEVTVIFDEGTEEITFAQTGTALENRVLTELSADIQFNTESVTWEVYYASNHPIAALRGTCFFEAAPVSGSSTKANNCAVVKPGGQKFFFDYNPDQPNRPKLERPEAALNEYFEPFVIIATKATGIRLSKTVNLRIPAVPTLPLGPNLNSTCEEATSSGSRRISRYFKYTMPFDWYALEVDSTTQVGVSILQQASGRVFGVLAPANTPTITPPLFGSGQTAIVNLNCSSSTPYIARFNVVTSSGTINIGQKQTVNISPRGDFYLIRNLPTSPPVFLDNGGTLLNVVGSNSTEIVTQNPIVELFDATRSLAENRCATCTSFNFVTLLTTPIPQTTEFALLLRRGNTNIDVLADFANSPIALGLDETKTGRLNAGSLPALFNLSMPSNQWVLIKNDQGLVVQATPNSGTWTLATPNTGQFGPSWTAALTNTGIQGIKVFQDPIFINVLFAFDTNVRMEQPISNIASGTPVSGSLIGNPTSPLFASTLNYAHMYTFDGTANQQINISIPLADRTTVRYVILDPTGAVFKQCDAQALGAAQCVNQALTLTRTGKYALVINPRTQGNATYAFTLNITP
jgi:PKD repeat protein